MGIQGHSLNIKRWVWRREFLFTVLHLTAFIHYSKNTKHHKIPELKGPELIICTIRPRQTKESVFAASEVFSTSLCSWSSAIFSTIQNIKIYLLVLYLVLNIWKLLKTSQYSLSVIKQLFRNKSTLLFAGMCIFEKLEVVLSYNVILFKT